MNTIRLILIFASVILSGLSGFAQPEYPYLRGADKSYEDGRFPDSETAYRKALELTPKGSTSYNLANTMLLQDRIPEAIEEYQKAIKSTDKPEIKSMANYNMGNAYYQNKEYEQSINAYKEALKIDPADEDAKKNLMLAMRQLKQQQEEKQKEEKKENKPQEQEEQPQDQQQPNKEEQQPQPQEVESPQPQEEKKEEINKEEAKEILKAIEREDQRVQEKLKKSQGKSVPPVKDW